MSRSRSISWRRFVVTTLLWSLALLLLTNMAWSVWFARSASMHGELMGMLDLMPAGISFDPEPPGVVETAYRRQLSAQTRYWAFRAVNVEETTPIQEPTPEDMEQIRSAGIGEFRDVVPRWMNRRHQRFSGAVVEGSDYAGEVYALVGWPVRLLWCSWRRTGADFFVTPDTGIEIEKPAAPPPGTGGFFGISLKESYSRALPFRPILTGQLAYGGLFFVVVCFVRWGLAALRRRRRSRRGYCAACAYNLRGNRSGVCPECGAPAQPYP